MAVFDSDEVEAIREIILIGTTATEAGELDGKLLALNEAQASSCRLDIAAYKKITYGTVKVTGGIKGTDHDIERDRLYITNRMRRRLNYPEVAGYLGEKDFGSITISMPSWSGSPLDCE